MSSPRPPLQESTAFLSTRISIAWLPSPPSEPTDTLVLTGTKYYVDLRILKDGGGLDWGMAGVKEMIEGGTTEAPKARFTNIIDSHYNPTHPPSSDTPAAAALPDEASFTLLPSGETLEAGTMLHPRTLLPTPYEEIWAPVPVERGSHVVILRSLFTQDEDRGRAFVGMCGDWAMGVYEIDTEGRGGFGGWKARRGEKKEGGWECVWESSGGETRRGWVGSWCADEGGEWEGWREGDKIRLGKEGEGKWEVLEHSLFGEGRPK